MYFFSSVFLTISQIFCLEVSLIRDQGWINVGTYGPMKFTRVARDLKFNSFACH